MPLNDLIESTKRFLVNRANAYRRVFARDNRDAMAVLADLGAFCRARKSTAHPDPYMAARLDGRREVFLRIADHTNLTTDELYRLYGGPVQKDPSG